MSVAADTIGPPTAGAFKVLADAEANEQAFAGLVKRWIEA
jgi:hypothetical protein